MLKIGDIPFFSKLSSNALEELKGLVECQSFPAHTVICRKGEPGKFLYAVASGGVTVSIGSPYDENRVFLGPGELFGEMSLLTGMPASATTTSAKHTQLFALSENAFHTLLKTQPQLHQGLIEMLVDRLRHRSSAAIATLTPICCFLVTDLDTSLCESVLSALHREIHYYSPESFLVDATRRGNSRNDTPKEIPPAKLAAFFPNIDKPLQLFQFAGIPVAKGFSVDPSRDWCENLVRNWKDYGSHDQVLLLALSTDDFLALNLELQPHDAILAVTDTAHLDACETLKKKTLNQADFSIAVVDAANKPNCDISYETWRFRLPADELHQAEKQERWRDVKPRNLPNLDWMARWITKREVGLSLSAGAARGFAHLGVLKVIEEAGIPIDCITGTSIGGIVALVYAMTGNAEQSIAILKESLGSNKKVRDIALFPRGSLYGGKKVKRAAREFFGDMRIPDLIKPCAVVAADLVNGERHVMDQGLAAEAALATSAIPGLFPPIQRDGKLLTDGALMNRLPVDVLEQRRCGLRIAVNVIPSPEARKKETAFTAEWLNERFSRVFGFKYVMSFAWELQAWTHSTSEAQSADIFIDPNTTIYSGYDFDRFDEMVDAGRIAAEEKLDLIRASAERSLRGDYLPVLEN